MAEISKINVGGTEYDIEKDVFWATYGTTTNAEITTAYQAGKPVFCNYNNVLYMLSDWINPTVQSFTAISSYTCYSLTCSNNSWSNVKRSVSINRTTPVNFADTDYTTLMARGEKLLDATTFDAVTDWSSQLVNGAIAWRYE